MSSTTRSVKKRMKARQRRRLTAQERVARDRRQAQHAAKVLEQALHELGLPEDLVAELEGRLRSQQKLLGKICGVMFRWCPSIAWMKGRRSDVDRSLVEPSVQVTRHAIVQQCLHGPHRVRHAGCHCLGDPAL
jgi:hypothetical protein